jgi:hypothetical protein
MMLQPWTLTSTSNRQLSFIILTKQNKLYDPEAYSTACKVFLLSNATTLTFDLEKQQGSSSHDGDKVYQDVWSWSLQFRLYPA